MKMRSIVDKLAKLKPLVRTGPGPGIGMGVGMDTGRGTGTGTGTTALTPLREPAVNPGKLRGWAYVPARLPPGAALVVVLHGCTQDAAGFDHGSGWSELAERHGFALLFPEQTRANNPNLCFNWFAPGDIRRGEGEVRSIREMIATMVADHRLAPSRVFVTGLSAGGAMAAAMLATYPEVFAAGAIIAGLPYGVASGVPQAMERMRGSNLPDGTTLARLVRDASPHNGPWPRVSIWHGTADSTVAPETGEALVVQWGILHGLPTAPSERRVNGALTQRIWRDAQGRVVMEASSVAGMSHGVPLATGGDGCGAAGAFMLDVGISSTARIADFFGLATADTKHETRAKPLSAMMHSGRIVEDALRAAGLMR
jgi:poly(hydroxyalkanoate) depolymerase family esterase